MTKDEADELSREIERDCRRYPCSLDLKEEDFETETNVL